jgi:rubrerythrin
MSFWKDSPAEPTEQSTYECFECGNVVESGSSPATCPECDGALRNRGTPME